MRFYQLEYRTTEYRTASALDTWPRARAHFNLDESFQYSSEKIKQYVADYERHFNPPTREWFGSERDAVVRRLELFKAGKLLGPKKDHEIWPVDVPTTKADLLIFLNKEAV